MPSPQVAKYFGGLHDECLEGTAMVRYDIQDDKLASHRRGCDALVSHDRGKTWNLDRRFELDRFDFLRAEGYWVDGMNVRAPAPP